MNAFWVSIVVSPQTFAQRVFKKTAILSSAAMAIAILFSINPSRGNDSGTDYKPAISAYISGNINSAVRSLTEIASGDAALADKMEARLLLANICDEIGDHVCVIQNNDGLMSLLGQAEDKLKTTYLLAIAPSLVRQENWTGQFDRQETGQLISKLNQENFFSHRPDKYLILQSAQIERALLRDDQDAARQAVSRLAASAVALPESHAYLLPAYLVEIMMGLYVSGDRYRALVYLNKFDDFIVNLLPHISATRLKYLKLSAELGANTGSSAALGEALKRLDEAAMLLQKAKAPQKLIDEEHASIELARTQFLILSQKLEDAADSHAKNPLQENKKAIQSAGHFTSLPELHFALTDVYLSFVHKVQPDKGWERGLSAPASWESAGAIGARLEAQRKFGLALLTHASNPALTQLLLNEASAKQITQFEKSLFSLDRSFPLPDFFDRILLGLTLDGLSQKKSLLPEERDLTVKIISVLQRNIMHSRGDILYLTAHFSSERTKGHAQTLLLLSDRRSELEIQGLQQRIDASLEAQKFPRMVQAAHTKRLETRSQLVALGNKINAMARAMPHLAVRSLPNSKQIASLLQPEEAVLAHAAFAGTGAIYKACVTPQNQLSLVKETPEQSMIVDMKIVTGALTAAHAPSPELDAQYPAQAAMRLHKLILGNVESCLAGKKRILYSPLIDFAPLPLAALLDKLPPKSGDGYDLSKASWVIRQYEVGNISSFTEFVAARQIARNVGAEFPFLGVGDPVLASGSKDQLLALRNGKTISHSISSLAELPATGVELKKIAAHYEEHKLLLREEASKRRFLKEPLGHFNVIEFATHGLITGELSGITEPGLVLSPSPEATPGTRDNGFLSSTEIAALRLKARLVVLSACNTAKFEVDAFAGGIRSLTSSFALAGSPAVIASLWPVESDTSQKLMTALFDKFKSGNHAASASLAHSMREFLKAPTSKAHLHPRFWAPFVVYGDGGIVARGPGPAARQGFSVFEAREEPGEIVSLARAEGAKGSYYASRLGGWDGKRFASIVEQRKDDGAVGWQVQDKRIAAGEIIAAQDRLFVEGFVSQADASAIPVLRSFDLDGKLLWSIELNGTQPLSFIADLVPAPSGKIWAAVYSGNMAAKKSELRIMLINRDGGVEKEWPLAVENETGGAQPALLVPGEKEDAYLFTYIPSAPTGVTADAFGGRHVCRGNDGTRIFKLGGENAAPQSLGLHAGVQILHAKRIGGTLYAAGVKRAACGSEGEPYFARLDHAAPQIALKEIYVEHGFEGGRFDGFIQRGGKIVLSGQVSSQIRERTTAPVPFDPVTGMSAPDFNRTDSFLVELNPSNPGPRPRLHFIDAGADLSISGLDERDGALTLAGSIGSHPFWGRYRLK